MAKNYDNITFTSSSSDAYSTFEKTYTFDGIYRRIISGGINTVNRILIKTGYLNAPAGSLETDICALTIKGSHIEYVRIKNLSPTSVLELEMYNTELSYNGEALHFHIQGGEVMQFHSQLEFANDGVLGVANSLIIGAVSGITGAADVFIGLGEF